MWKDIGRYHNGDCIQNINWNSDTKGLGHHSLSSIVSLRDYGRRWLSRRLPLTYVPSIIKDTRPFIRRYLPRRYNKVWLLSRFLQLIRHMGPFCPISNFKGDVLVWSFSNSSSIVTERNRFDRVTVVKYKSQVGVSWKLEGTGKKTEENQSRHSFVIIRLLQFQLLTPYKY